MAAVCTPKCKSNEICVPAITKKNGVHVDAHCTPDVGAKGKTPSAKKWIPAKSKMKGKFAMFLPDKKMPFNKPLKDQTSACNVAGKKLKDDKVSSTTAIRRAMMPYNANKRLAKSGAPSWDSQRKACLDGVRKAYGIL